MLVVLIKRILCFFSLMIFFIVFFVVFLILFIKVFFFKSMVFNKEFLLVLGLLIMFKVCFLFFCFCVLEKFNKFLKEVICFFKLKDIFFKKLLGMFFLL